MTLRWMASTTAEHLPVAVDEDGEVGWSSMRQSLKILPDDHPATIAVRSITAQLTAYDNILGDDIDWNYQVVAGHYGQRLCPPRRPHRYDEWPHRRSWPDEVAGVIAHEMAHVMHRHGLQRVAHSLGLVAVVQFLLGDFGGIAAGTTQMITMAETNDYSRDAEREAGNENDASGRRRPACPGNIFSSFVRGIW